MRRIINISSLFLLLILSLPVKVYGIVTGQALVNAASNYIGTPYESGQPPNKEYAYGAIFDLDKWNGNFDCSGLVSYCADLRRHYGVSEFYFRGCQVLTFDI